MFNIEYYHPRVLTTIEPFPKKTRTTPGHDLAIARKRTKEIQRG